MQNKGFVIFISAVLAVICLYYLSFTPAVNHYEKKAAEIAQLQGDAKAKAYLDSMANEKIWFGYTLKKARTQQIGLGLDLKGGMNVILRVNAKDLVYNLSGKYDDDSFLKALDAAAVSTTSGDFIDKFVAEFKKLSHNTALATVFGNGPLREEISPRSADDQVIKILKEKFNSASEATINVLRTRIDRFGVVSPNIQKIEGEGRILIELPGVKEPERVRDLLQKSANLQFWRTYSYQEVQGDLINANQKLSALAKAPVTHSAESINQEELPAAAENAELSDATANKEKEDLTDKDVVEQEVKANDKTSATSEEGKTESNASQATILHEKDNILFSLLSPGGRGGATVGIAHDADRKTIDSLLLVAHEKGFLREDLKLIWGNKPITDPSTKKETDLYELYAIRNSRTGEPDLTGDVVTSSKSEVSDQKIGNRGPVVTMTMNEEGARHWARLTKENIGRAIAIVLDDVVYSAPNVNSEITGGRSEISGSFTVEETVDLANVLNSGKMDASVVIEQENVVGPSLGQGSIRAGIISFVIAIILLMIYMVMMYGLVPGLIVDGALIINTFFTLGILASFHSVLTLSGIAGIVLTLGMAVDANVLIFERIKEEIRAGKSMTRAINDGYGNAFSAIFDSNITTIITGIVLFFFGTGPIRGFATTLIIGLIASFLTAVFLTRIIAEALDKKGKMSKQTYTTSISKNFFTNCNYNILGSWKKGIILPIVLIVLGIVALSVWGFNQGIEFSGGRNFIVEFDQPVKVKDVSEKVRPVFNQKASVISIGTDGKQVRISTNYEITNNTKAIEDTINNMLYESVQDFYLVKPDKETFLTKNIISSQKVSASMSQDIARKALIAVIIALVFMAIYILIRFRYIHYSIGAFASVVATTLCILGLYALLWRIMPFTMELDQNFIAAVLAIIGYSINDVVVVFDRIRETHNLYPNRDLFTSINESLNRTLARTFNTSLTTFLVMIIIFLFGGASMRSFTFAILLGIVIGTYSTLFVATPVTYLIAKAGIDRKKTKQAK